MICETCHGTRWVEIVQVEADGLFAMTAPCPECAGQCFTHCCDGEQAQPDKTEQA